MKTVGVVGGGQLGQMLGEAAQEIGVKCLFLDPGNAPPARTAGRVLKYAFDDLAGLEELAAQCDVVTYEFENVPVDTISQLPSSVPVFPPVAALRIAQDRLLEKTAFTKLGIPTPSFRNVECAQDLAAAADQLGLPLVVKTRRLGYDGKGQMVVRPGTDFGRVWEDLGKVPLLAEQLVPFDFEVSAIGARSQDGCVSYYPLTNNQHRNGILRTSLAPAGTPELAAVATEYHARLLNHLDYVGVLALELFVVGDRLLANEFAPRVHNSGHWTIEGSAASQFENHIRAVAGFSLADPTPVLHSAMENILDVFPDDPDAMTRAGYHVHDYGKSPRPGRKLGHVTAIATEPDERDTALSAIRLAIASEA